MTIIPLDCSPQAQSWGIKHSLGGQGSYKQYLHNTPCWIFSQFHSIANQYNQYLNKERMTLSSTQCANNLTQRLKCTLFHHLHPRSRWLPGAEPIVSSDC